MKRTALLIAALVFLLCSAAAHTAYAQEKKDAKDANPAVQTGQEQSKAAQAQQKDAQPEFVDEDGDGINDNTSMTRRQDDGGQSARQLRERRRDHFIDNDGDGINDNRCGGMGIMQGRRRGQQKGGQQ